MVGTGNQNGTKASIAIVGMACEFPGAHTPEELWQNVLAGRRYFRKAPPERMPLEYFDPDPHASDKSYCDRMAVIEGWQFDFHKFHIPPVTFRASDIAHWLALHVADAAVRNSGVDLATIDRSRAAVVLGNTLTGEFNRSHYLRLRWPYAERALRRSLAQQGFQEAAIRQILGAFKESYNAPLPEASEDSLAGNMSNTIAGRISNYFDLGGGSFAVDGACSSALLSMVVAADALRDNRLDVALAGGVDVSLDPFEIIGFAKAQALAREDIRPYDERANGMLTGEGCGMFVLMREADARAKGLAIHALLKGWAFASDGKGAITAPDVEGQRRTLRKVYTHAGYPMSSVGLIEGHGTGTPLGDKVELQAVQSVLGESGDEVQCVIGSVKANIGHCKAAAGAAGLIKAIHALKHKILPPTVNCEGPNRLFAESNWKLRPSTKGGAWEKDGCPRRASVSSMGFGGANAHVTLEEANPEEPPSAEHLRLLGSHQSSELIPLSAPDLPALLNEVTRLLSVAKKICLAELTDLSATLTRRPGEGRFRLAFVASTPWQLCESLERARQFLEQGKDLDSVHDPASGIFASTTVENPRWVALFPGQGSQRLNMCWRLRERFPFAAELFDPEGGNYCGPHDAGKPGRTGMSALHLAPLIFRETQGATDEQVKAWESELRLTRNAQPAIVACSVAALRVLDHLGLRPNLALGHSLGEITALHAGGCCDASTAVHIAALRGEAMSSLSVPDPGAMLAIADTPEVVEALIRAVDQSLVISNYNSSRQTVVSGGTEAIHALKARCEQDQIRCSLLPVSHAFHSDIVAPAAVAFLEALHQLPGPLVPPKPGEGGSTTVISTATGDLLPPKQDVVQLLSNQIRQPVRFVDAVRAAAESRPHLWVEVGPGGVLTSLVREITGQAHGACRPMDLRGEEAMHLLNQLLAQAFVLGFPVRLANLFSHRFHQPFDLEQYRPVFITNPCERPVELPAQPALRFSSEGAALPESPFLREFVELYERHHRETRVTVPPGSTPSAQPATGSNGKQFHPPETKAVSLLDFAIRWIAKRTGIPGDQIKPENKLRDDLGLDSIKAGELVLNLSQETKRPFAGDPGIFANSSLSEVIKALEAVDPETVTQDAAKAQRLDTVGSVQSLEPWVRSFRMVPMLYPLEEEKAKPLPTSGRIFIFAETNYPPAKILAEILVQRGLQAAVSDPSTLIASGDSPADLSGIVVFIPQQDKPFYACSPEEFSRRVDGTSEFLFRLFGWLGHGHQRDWSALRALAVRPVASPTDQAPDLDAGAAFLKSLRLEHPGASPKWISLPGAWDAHRIAQTLIAELETTSERVARHYDLEGRRFTDMALPLEAAGGALPQIGPEDVVVVTGGAKGITAELALALGRLTKAKLALFGSSPMPESSAERAGNEITGNLERFAQAGVVCRYYQCDVSDAEAVRAAVANAERELGPITGVLHGSGISKLQLFREKPLEDFLACVRVKAAGLYHLLACIPPARLRMLHVVSSVLGKTGMRGQTDYTLANAWLDGAVRSVKATFPHIHCLTLGYSVWEETGLGKKLGAADYLRSVGVRPIQTREGVEHYMALLQHGDSGPVFVTTGNLTPDLEGNLYPGAPTLHGRFLEQLRRWIPQTEICADATLSHQTDLYLPEHVYYGTPLFPGVMAIEAMVQAANACQETEELPVLRNIEFRRPLIVPEDKSVVIRTMALADKPTDGVRRVRVAIRSDQDNFQADHFTAECWYGLTAPGQDSLPKLPPLSEPLPLNPEDLYPIPLFQGKLFRRIETVFTRQDQKESLTAMEAPAGEKYFQDGLPPAMATGSPVVRDACLQSGAIILPPGCLPERIGGLRPCVVGKEHKHLRCRTLVHEARENQFRCEYALFDERGRLLEHMTDIILSLPQTTPSAPPKPEAPISAARVVSDLAALLPNFPHALAIVSHADLETQPELKPAEVAAIKQSVNTVRTTPALAKVIATRRCAVEFVRKYRDISAAPTHVHIHSNADGRPELHSTETALIKALAGVGVSLADSGAFSIALVGEGPVGADIEIVTPRSAELWRGLLNDHGYALALHLAAATHEPFDTAATRVWTVLESAKKLTQVPPGALSFDGCLGGSWLSLRDSSTIRFYCAVIKQSRESSRAVVSIAFASAERKTSYIPAGTVFPNDVPMIYGRPEKPSDPASHSQSAPGNRVRLWRLASPGIDNCRLETAPAPTLSKSNAILAIRAISVSYRDLLIARGIYSKDMRLPLVLGSEVAGEIIELEQGAGELSRGQGVIVNTVPEWLTGDWQDGFLSSVPVTGSPGLAAERVSVPAHWLTPFPQSLGFQRASTLASSGVTAWNALRSIGEVTPGQTVLTLGTGSVSLFVLQFAKAMGCQVIVTSSDDERLARARKLGADHTVNYKRYPDWDQEVLRTQGGRGVDLTVETAGVRTLPKSIAATKPGGRIAYVGTIAGTLGQLDASPIILKNLRVQGIYCGSAEHMRNMVRFMDEKGIVPIIDRVFPFEEYPSALTYLSSGRPFGKVIVQLPPTL